MRSGETRRAICECGTLDCSVVEAAPHCAVVRQGERSVRVCNTLDRSVVEAAPALCSGETRCAVCVCNTLDRSVVEAAPHCAVVRQGERSVRVCNTLDCSVIEAVICFVQW